MEPPTTAWPAEPVIVDPDLGLAIYTSRWRLPNKAHYFIFLGTSIHSHYPMHKIKLTTEIQDKIPFYC